ncbi:MAG: citrate/2-methylcitrate synthase [Lachnospiraceae bacterium]|nr:citrate/2-methylcitrate synthase [Lachnospiraceae bacterium]MBO4788826.1 citrate/2-methylcitrate synthase [Lachnospiraceae bacterium]
MSDSSMMKLDEKGERDFQFLVNECRKAGVIDQNLYVEYDVKRGLRDSNGAGVLTGLTEISDVTAYKLEDGKKVPADGKLYYQGYDVQDMVKGFAERRYAFEETTYLLLFGELPNETELKDFVELITTFQTLSNKFIRDVIMKAVSGNIMNSLQKSILTLYSYDDNAEDISAENVLRQSINLIAKLPVISIYAYWSYLHFRMDESLIIRNPKPEYSTAENILSMLRPDGRFTELEAKVLDICLVIHAEHGGGNNSTFTTHVVTSSGTDTYSATAAAIASLKGYRHGGANLKVRQMFADLKENVLDWKDEGAIRDYLTKVVRKEAFDKTGLVYGIGHAVYTISDPRQVILRDYAIKLAEAKDRMDELQLYFTVERIAKEVIAENRHLFKPLCANVDFYSGFVYDMLGIPEELYTPIFAISRISGWAAHRMEEIINNGKIIRPAYKYVGTHRTYSAMEDRPEE